MLYVYRNYDFFLLFCYDLNSGGTIMEDLEIKEIEKKKRSLKRYKKNRALVNRLEEKLNLLDNRITSLRSPKVSDMPRGGTPITTEDLVSDKIELEERIERLKTKGKKLRSEILEEIDTLDEVKHAEILEMFFIDCMNPEDIAEAIPCNIRTVYRLYSEGVRLLTLNEQ